MREVSSIDDYIRSFPISTRKLLQQMRRTIRKAAPKAEEAVKYGIPTFTLNGNLVHFGGYEHHVSFYPTSSPMKAFKRELSRYQTSRGTIRFPIDEPLPLALIGRIVRFRVAEVSPFQELAAPAQRALGRAGITSVKRLSSASESQLSRLHGIGPDALRTLRTMLRASGLKFKGKGKNSTWLQRHTGRVHEI
jgi:uncharacterized protein YdhG (YjbR/CyaY superfamily)